MKETQMNKKKEKSQNSASFVQWFKRNRGEIILVITGFIVISVINFFSVATSKTVSTFDIRDFEVGMISDRTIISPKSFPLDLELNVQIEEGEKIIRKGFKIEEENFKKLRKLDELKLKKCKKNGINVLYYTNLRYKIFLKEKIYTDKNELIKTIFTA